MAGQKDYIQYDEAQYNETENYIQNDETQNNMIVGSQENPSCDTPLGIQIVPTRNR
jgi:hypothetical protein